MATSCEGNNWFWVYFTSVKNIAKCDICYTSFQITEVPKDNIPKDLLSNHLKKTHKINEDKAAEICGRLRKYYFDDYDTDMKRQCKSCYETILNKPLILMSHLSKAHEVDVHLEIRSVGFLTSLKWMWEYFTRSEEQEAKCSVCSEHFVLRNDVSTIKKHIISNHGDIFDVSENSEANKNWPYSITENNKLKCDNCDKSYDLIFYATTHMKTHLVDAHNLNEDIARKLCNWVLEYFHISNLQTSKCNICVNMFQTSNSFDLMLHLKEAHQVRVSPEIIPTRNWVWEYYTRSEGQEAKCSVCSDHFVLRNVFSTMKKHIISNHGNIFDVSENSKANKNWPYSITENNKLKCDNCDKSYDLIFYATTYMKTHLVDAHNLNEDIARKLCNWVLEYFQISNLRTSKCNKCENVFKKSNFFNLMIHLKEAHQIWVPLEIIPAGLSCELSSLFNPDRCAENNAPSSSYNQPPGNVEQSSDYDNLYDQINNPSEMQTARCADNNAPSSSFNQPTRNVDQSSYCDNLYVHIDNPLKIITTWYKKWRHTQICSLLNSDRYAQDIATSSKSQESTRSFYQSSDWGNSYDQIDESSEIRTTRYARDIATSSKSQESTRSFDQSSDWGNFYDQIDESSEIRTTRLLSSSSRLLNSDNNAEDIAASSSWQQATCSRY